MKALNELQAKDFAKWLRKQIRVSGHRFEVGSIQVCPVEAFVKEITGVEIGFICGGEIEIRGDERQVVTTDWTATSYYMMDEDGMMVIEAGKMLDIILLDDQE